ncbi:ATP-binding protein [Paraburkholderia sp. UCT31]|uniref:ATP-binding protein n=1 Tax=Paraburkholderia sp. UCT31 TaxID=2615209 RepID=UPI00165526DF|nr:ATP-binding protein [Paraburkholderia sp. UCT31]MBC8739762.1 ATP-binding protein [Paraburkholderia sp. UCT31]
MAEKQQRRSLKVHPAILHSVIGAQSGTLGKALLEAIMNSHDSGSKECRVTLTKASFEVRDDGRGFQSEEEIEHWFETFGTPHEEGDAEFGRFRVGRGQLLNFGVNFWRSGTFRMVLDYKKDGFDYDLTSGLKAFKGCHIKAELYKPLTDDEMSTAESELRRLVRYAPIAVRLNGKLISRDPEKLKWDVVTDDAYIKIDRSKELEVFNKGVFVRSYPEGDFGAGGEIVSKHHLKLNFARNDILRFDCEIFKRIEDKIKERSFEIVRGKRNLNKGEREFLSRRVNSYDTPMDKSVVADLPLILDVQGKVRTIREVLAAPQLALSTSKKALVGQKVQEDGLAVVLPWETLEQFGLYRYEEETDVDVLKRFMRRLELGSGLFFDGNAVELGALAEGLKTDYRVFEVSELDAGQRAFLHVLEHYQDAFLKLFRKAERPEKRVMKLGDSSLALAWTDGKSYVTYTVGIADGVIKGGVDEMSKALLLQLHEYCHDDNDLDDHGHDFGFYQKFHDFALHRMTQLSELARKMDKALRRELVKTGAIAVSASTEDGASSARARSLKGHEVQEAMFAARQVPLFDGKAS